MKKIYLLLAAALLACGASAQITTGEPNASVMPRIGNRPTQGTWGIYAGVSASQIKDWSDNDKSDQTIWGLPIVSLKYYVTDNWEVRCGFEFDASRAGTSTKYDGKKGSTASGTNFTRFYPGVAYHFNTHNLLDVYAGAQLPIGYDMNTTSQKYDGDYMKTRNNTFVIGGGAFIGLQAFIADLPLAVGIELGYSGLATRGGVDYHINKIDGKVTKYYGSDEKQEKNSTWSANWKGDASVHISYYFNAKK